MTQSSYEFGFSQHMKKTTTVYIECPTEGCEEIIMIEAKVVASKLLGGENPKLVGEACPSCRVSVCVAVEYADWTKFVGILDNINQIMDRVWRR